MTALRAGRVAWWLLVVVFLAGTVLALPLKGPFTKDDLIVIPFATWGLVGALVAARRPGNPMGWLFLSIGALAGVAGLAAVVTAQPGAGLPPVPWYVVLCAWYQNWFWYPTFALSTGFTLLLFPAGLPSPRWRPLLWLAVTSVATLTVLAALDPMLSSASTVRPVDNPLSPEWLPVVAAGTSSWLFRAAGLTALACAAAAAVSVVVRYRRAQGVERLQLRWFVFSVVVVVLVFVLMGAGSAAGHQDDELAVNILSAVTLAFIPLSCGLAVLRYRLYDIDRIVSRTTAYALVTGVVVGIYAALVTLVPRLVPVSSSLAVAGATLVAAAVARPALRRAQQLVDRRFNRAHVDAEHVVDTFGSRLRDEVDPDAVCADLLAAVGRTMQPATIRLWVRG